MSRPCMTDPFEECCESCPNCRRAMYSNTDDGWNADYNDFDGEDEDDDC